MTVRAVRTPVLDIAYEEHGPSGGDPALQPIERALEA